MGSSLGSATSISVCPSRVASGSFLLSLLNEHQNKSADETTNIRKNKRKERSLNGRGRGEWDDIEQKRKKYGEH